MDQAPKEEKLQALEQLVKQPQLWLSFFALPSTIVQYTEPPVRQRSIGPKCAANAQDSKDKTMGRLQRVEPCAKDKETRENFATSRT